MAALTIVLNKICELCFVVYFIYTIWMMINHQMILYTNILIILIYVEKYFEVTVAYRDIKTLISDHYNNKIMINNLESRLKKLEERINN